MDTHTRADVVVVSDASTLSLAHAARRAFDAVPDDVLTAARLHLLDALAVGVLASRQGPVRDVVDLARTGGQGSCSVLGTASTTTAPVAALANGALIHSLEFDDTHVPSVMHGSSVVAPSALASSQEVGAPAERLLRSFAVGWELLIRIGLASPGRIQAQGFQITSAAGAFAAAAVSALVRGDEPETLATAVGIAGSQAAGTFAFLADGDTVKAVQPGWAAHSGMLAAELARCGITGPRGVFDGRFGFYSLYAQDPDAGGRLAHELDHLGQRWYLPEAAYKLVPCCHYIHPFVEAVAEVMASGVTADDIARIHCRVPEGAVPVIADRWEQRQHPARGHDARWSLPYVLGLVLRDGRVSATHFDGDRDDDVVRLAERVSYEVWPDSGFPARFPAHVTVQLVDGPPRVVEIHDVKGGSNRPIIADDVIAKALGNLAEAGIPSREADAFVSRLVVDSELELERIQPTP